MTDSPAQSPSPTTTGARPTLGDRVFRVYALRGALSVPGVVDHVSGINRITGRGLPRAEVRWDADHASVTVDLQIAVSWPAPVVDVARTVRSCVARWITDATGVPVSVVNVEVAAVVPDPDSRVTGDALAAADHGPDLTPVEATPLTVTAPVVHRDVPDPVHPTAPGHMTLTPVHAPRPAAPAHVPVPEPPHPSPVTVRHLTDRPEVSVPPRRPLTPVRLPPHTPPTPVNAPAPVTALLPGVPGLPPLRRVEVTHRAPGHVEVHHRPVHSPVPPERPGVLHGIPTPPGPRIENIPTPQGLPVTAVPTPRGLPLTVFPQVVRYGTTPVTVRHRPPVPVTVDRRHRDPAPERNDS